MMMDKSTLWLIDDDSALRLILEDTFNNAGFNVIVFANAKGAWTKLTEALHESETLSESTLNQAPELPDVILTDIRMPMMDGLSFSQWVKANFPNLPIVIMTAHSDLNSAVDSYQAGAFEYLPKPFDLDDAVNVINKAIKSVDSNTKTSIDKYAKGNSDNTLPNNKHRVDTDVPSAKGQYQNNQLKDIQLSADQPTESQSIVKQSTKTRSTNSHLIKNTHNIDMIGQSLPMQSVFRAIGRLSKSPISVLITGESGTGKELVASALHRHSVRTNKPFIALNMAAIPQDLIESELFGHEKGAFTGATTQRQGRFEQANGGTLFLDEIGDMPFSTQTRLLRVLANGEFFRVGGQEPIKVDVRIIAATHQNLEQLVKEGKFREDLFYRLNVISLPLPTLRTRRDDIPELTEYFLARAAIEMDTEQKHLSDKAMTMIQNFDWPGNVRQLENACRWITVMAVGQTVKAQDLPPELLEFAKKSNLNPNFEASTNSNIDPNLDLYEQNDFSISSDIISTDNHLNSLMSDYQLENNFAEHSAEHKINSSSWQDSLNKWAENTLKSGNTDILRLATPEFERVLLKAALKHTNGRKGDAAALLGWGRNTLARKMKKLGLESYL